MSENQAAVSPRRKRGNEPAVQVALSTVAARRSALDRAEFELREALEAAKERGASYRELADAAGMNHETVRRMLNGRLK